MEQGFSEFKDELLTNEQEARGPRNFRLNSDVESFYRFVNENGLRREAHMMLERIVRLKSAKTGRGRKSKTTH